MAAVMDQADVTAGSDLAAGHIARRQARYCPESYDMAFYQASGRLSRTGSPNLMPPPAAIGPPTVIALGIPAVVIIAAVLTTDLRGAIANGSDT